MGALGTTEHSVEIDGKTITFEAGKLAPQAGGSVVSSLGDTKVLTTTTAGPTKDFLPFFPLANGLFTGKFTRTERPADTRIARQRPQVADEAPWDAMEAYAAFCAARGISMLEATFGWFLARPEVSSVIPERCPNRTSQ